MKAKMLEYIMMKSQKMSVLHVVVYLRMMPIHLTTSELNIPINENCQVWAHAQCLEMCKNPHVCKAHEPCLLNL